MVMGAVEKKFVACEIHLKNACRGNHQVNIRLFLVFVLMVHISTMYICHSQCLTLNIPSPTYMNLKTISFKYLLDIVY